MTGMCLLQTCPVILWNLSLSGVSDVSPVLNSVVTPGVMRDTQTRVQVEKTFLSLFF